MSLAFFVVFNRGIGAEDESAGLAERAMKLLFFHNGRPETRRRPSRSSFSRRSSASSSSAGIQSPWSFDGDGDGDATPGAHGGEESTVPVLPGFHGSTDEDDVEEMMGTVSSELEWSGKQRRGEVGMW